MNIVSKVFRPKEKKEYETPEEFYVVYKIKKYDCKMSVVGEYFQVEFFDNKSTFMYVPNPSLQREITVELYQDFFDRYRKRYDPHS